MDILSIYPEIIDELLYGVVHCMHCKMFAGINFYLKRISEEILNLIYTYSRSDEGRKACHNNFSSESHSPHFLVRATSESLFFDYFVLKSLKFLKIKLFFKNLATLGHKI